MDEQTAASADICELAFTICQLDVDASRMDYVIDTCPLPLDGKEYPPEWHGIVRDHAKALAYILRSRMPSCRGATSEQFLEFLATVRNGEDVGVDAIMPVYKKIKRSDKKIGVDGASRSTFGRLN